MKIMLFITGLEMGGAETQVCNLADNLAHRGHDVLLLALTGEAIMRPSNHGVKVILLGMQKNLFGLVSGYIKARESVKKFNPDVIHSHMVHANIFARALRVFTEIPRLICTAHNTNEGGGVRPFLYRITDFLADISTNVSNEAVEAFVAQKSVPSGRMICVSNGINTEKFSFNEDVRKSVRAELNIADDCSLILAVGRLTEAKDYPNLLYSLSKIVSANTNISVAIIGVGELREELEQLVVKLGLLNKVHFLGLRRDVHDVMSAADLFVLSSAWEGFGLVVAEAMSCERVVIATDCGGVGEVLGPYDYLVPAHDSDKLAAAMNSAINLSAEQREALGKSLRSRVMERYSLDAVIERWIELYKGRVT